MEGVTADEQIVGRQENPPALYGWPRLWTAVMFAEERILVLWTAIVRQKIALRRVAGSSSRP